MSSDFSRRAFLRTAGVAGLGLALTGGRVAARPFSASRPAPMAAVRASAFLDSIGINTHWGYTDTPYYSRYGEAADLLDALGVRHQRFGLDDRPYIYRLYLDQLDRGQQALVLCDLRDPRHGGATHGQPQHVTEMLDWARQFRRDADGRAGDVVALEGPNEADLFWDPGKSGSPRYRTYGGQEGAHGARLYQIELARQARADAELRDLTLIGPCHGVTYDPGGGKPNPWAPGSLEDYVDWGNFHPYPFGGNVFSYPRAYAGLDHYYRDGNKPSGNLEEYPYAFNTYRPPFGDKPMACTETGYPTHTRGSSEEVQGRYVPRVFAEYFRLGIKRTYLYELLDEFPDATNKEARFGILRRDLTPKPAYTALKSLIGLLAGAGESAEEVDSVELSISVAPAGSYTRTQYVHHLLLKGSDSYWLLFWHEIASEDTSETPRPVLDHPPMPTTLQFGQSLSDAVLYTYGPNWKLRPTPAPIRSDNTVVVPATDQISVFQFRI